jgi:hypothetical protein
VVGHNGEEADLTEAKGSRRALEPLHAEADNLCDRGAAVIAADDPAGNAGSTAPELGTLHEHYARPPARSAKASSEGARDRQAMHAPADYDVRG